MEPPRTSTVSETLTSLREFWQQRHQVGNADAYDRTGDEVSDAALKRREPFTKELSSGRCAIEGSDG